MLPEKKEDDAPFIPERDISEKDWQEMKKFADRKIEDFLEDKDFPFEENLFGEITKTLASMAIISSEKVAELNIKKLPSESIEGVFKSIRGHDWGPGTTLLWLGRMKVGHIERVNEFSFTREEWEKEIRRLKYKMKKKDWVSALLDVFEIKLYRPKDAELKECLKTGADALIAGIVEHVQGWREMTGWMGVARLTRMLKILFPDRVKDFKPDKIAWQGMRKTLESLRHQSEWAEFAELAAAMTILAAEKVEVTEKGLEITMPKPKEDFREAREPRPVRRSF